MPRNRSSRGSPPASRSPWWSTPVLPAFPIRGRGWWRGCVPPAIVSYRYLALVRRWSRCLLADLAKPSSCSMDFCRARPGRAREVLRQLAHLPWALVFYEAPHRIVETVAALAEAFGPERTLVIARELTKLFESIHSCPLGEAQDWLLADGNRQRGEFVLLVAGAAPVDESAEGERVLKLLLDEGLPVSQASRLAHLITGVGKKVLYQHAAATAGIERNCIRRADPGLQANKSSRILLCPPAGASMQITITRPDDWHLPSARWRGHGGRAAAHAHASLPAPSSCPTCARRSPRSPPPASIARASSPRCRRACRSRR
jgi:hypothetical protein